jgi:predicted RNA binding protein YcfA (HicA-like mRNA interferase family)
MDLFDEIKRNPKNVSPKKIIQLLERFEFEHKRTTGDHKMYKLAGYRTIPIPIGQNPLACCIVKEILSIIEEILEDK